MFYIYICCAAQYNDAYRIWNVSGSEILKFSEKGSLLTISVAVKIYGPPRISHIRGSPKQKIATDLCNIRGGLNLRTTTDIIKLRGGFQFQAATDMEHIHIRGGSQFRATTDISISVAFTDYRPPQI